MRTGISKLISRCTLFLILMNDSFIFHLILGAIIVAENDKNLNLGKIRCGLASRNSILAAYQWDKKTIDMLFLGFCKALRYFLVILTASALEGLKERPQLRTLFSSLVTTFLHDWCRNRCKFLDIDSLSHRLVVGLLIKAIQTL